MSSIETLTLPNGNTYDLMPTMTGASAQSAGASGAVPAPSAGDQNKVLKGDGTWGTVEGVGGIIASTIDPGEGVPMDGDLYIVYEEGSGVSAVDLSTIPTGSLVVDTQGTGTSYGGDPIVFRVLEHGHTGDPAGTTALECRDIITLKAFDAKEPNNSDTYRVMYGNNRYLYSNILQWLNSDAVANEWYTAQHSTDHKPDISCSWIYPQNSGIAINPYDTENGFLSNLSEDLRSALQTVTKTTAKNTVTDGGGSESVQSKIFLLSTTEVGLANVNGIDEGSIYKYYLDNNQNSRRVKKVANAAACGNYTETSADSVWYWQLRTPDVSRSYSNHCVRIDGSDVYGNDTCCYVGGIGVSPAFCIPSTTKVALKSDGTYEIQWNTNTSRIKKVYRNDNGVTQLIDDEDGATGGRFGWEEANIICAKNLLPYPFSDTTKTVNGITFTDNGDGTVSANGTATADAVFTIRNSDLVLSNGGYIANGCPANGSSSTYQMYLTQNGDVKGSDFGDGFSFVISNSTPCDMVIKISSGATISNITFKPMIRFASNPDDTWVPYAMTNRELTEYTVFTTVNLSITTDKNGNAGMSVTNIPYDNYVLLAVVPNVGSYDGLYTPFYSSTVRNWYIHVSNWDGSKVTNRAISFTAYWARYR